MKTQRFLNILIVVVLLLQGGFMLKLGDRLISYVDGTMVNQQEVEQLRQDLNRVGPIADAVAGWFPQGGDNPTFGEITAQQGIFDISPNGGSYFYEATADKAISNITWTPIDVVGPNHSYCVVLADESDNTKMLWNGAYKNTGVLVMLNGSTSWASNASGLRALRISYYKVVDDTLNSSTTLYEVNATNGDVTVTSFSYPLSLNDTTYAKIEAYQNSGGSLALNRIRLAFFRIK